VTAIVVGEVGEVGDVRVGVTSDGRVWALGRSFTPAEADQLGRFIVRAAGLASSGDGGQDAGAEDGKFL
jgi:hypothetical protein